MTKRIFKNIFIAAALVSGGLGSNTHAAEATIDPKADTTTLAADRWWPGQKKAAGVVRCDPGATPSAADVMLGESLAGVAAQAVNEGRGDELVWLESKSHPGYERFYPMALKRTGAKERGTFELWDLVERYAKSGVVKGYVVYNPRDESANVATTLAGVHSGVLITPRQVERAQKAGLKELADARGKSVRWVFDTYKDKLCRTTVLSGRADRPHLRDMAVAQRMLCFWGNADPAPAIYEWMTAPGLVIGYVPDENAGVRLLSEWGHVLSPSDWCRNATFLSAGADDYVPTAKADLPPAKSTWDGKTPTTAIIMSDGDNVQWIAGDFIDNKYFWADKQRGAVPVGWGLPYACLEQVYPDVYETVFTTRTPNDSMLQCGGGYFFPDHFASARGPEQRKVLLKRHAQKINTWMKRAGGTTQLLLCDDLNSPATLEACQVLADEIPGLQGIFIIQYLPYEGGEGKVFWVKNKAGEGVPVMSSRYTVRIDLPAKRAGTPAQIAAELKHDAANPPGGKAPLLTWAMMLCWSEFVQSAGDGPNDERPARDYKGPFSVGYAPSATTVKRLAGEVEVVSPEELIRRLKTQHAKE